MLKRLRPLVISLLDARGLQRQRHSGRSGFPGTRSGENAIYERRTDLPGRRHVFGDFGLLDPATPHRLGDRPDKRGRRLRTCTTAAETHGQPIKISNKPRERGESDLSSFLSYAAALPRMHGPHGSAARQKQRGVPVGHPSLFHRLSSSNETASLFRTTPHGCRRNPPHDPLAAAEKPDRSPDGLRPLRSSDRRPAGSRPAGDAAKRGSRSCPRCFRSG